MKKILNEFLFGEDGAVTVDFVVLTAGLVLIGVLATQAIIGGGTDLASEIGQNLEDRPLGVPAGFQ